jgi:hypothetical protein
MIKQFFRRLSNFTTKVRMRWYKDYNRDFKENTTYPYVESIIKCRYCIHRSSELIKMGKITKCPLGHKLKVIGHSCCDDICECECGKWFVCGLGSIWRYR